MENIDNNYFVYMHINKINSKIYVGQTCQIPKDRWGKDGNNYLKQDKAGRYVHDHFARAILKYGWDNFDHIIVAEELTLSEANQLEDDLIKYYNTMNPKDGYNSVSGGQKGRVYGEETIKKLQESHLGKMMGTEHPRHKEVVCLETGEIYGSTFEADRKNEVSRGSVWMGITERAHTINGKHFYIKSNMMPCPKTIYVYFIRSIHIQNSQKKILGKEA